MKIKKCIPCNRVQKDGNFCLDCGKELTEIITSDVSFKPIESGRDSSALKRDVRKWLNRIGIQNSDIQIDGSDGAEIVYRLNGKEYHFKSVLQKTNNNNLAAVEQFLHHRVLGIERGIESAEMAFKGYEALPDPNDYLKRMSDKELKAELVRVHPDTGTGDRERWALLMIEKKRRGDDEK